MFVWLLESPAASEAEDDRLHKPACKQEGQVSTTDVGTGSAGCQQETAELDQTATFQMTT